jgi:hypothetical protein
MEGLFLAFSGNGYCGIRVNENFFLVSKRLAAKFLANLAFDKLRQRGERFNVIANNFDNS